MSNSIFMLSKYLKKSVATALILGLMLAPGLSAAQGISSSIGVAAQAAELETEAEETQAAATQAATEKWSAHANTSWYDDNPTASSYTLTSAEQLAGLAKLVNDGTCNFKDKSIIIRENIDLGAYEWVPIGNYQNKFQGWFYGGTIDNMKIGQENNPANYRYAGLFGYVKGAIIDTVTIGKNSQIYNSGSCSAAVCAYAENSEINYCTNEGNVCEEKGVAAGICADCSETDYSTREVLLNGCCNSGDITSKLNDAAGICGAAMGLSIKDCSNKGNVSSNKSAAGICAAPRTTSIISCYNSGTIKSEYTSPTEEIRMTPASAGGICVIVKSYGNIEINSCYNDGDVVCKSFEDAYAGGILGYLSQEANSLTDSATITNCYNQGFVSADGESASYAGGIVGYARLTTINNCVNLSDDVMAYGNDNRSYDGEICGYTSYDSTINETYYEDGTGKNGHGYIDDDQETKTVAVPKNRVIAESGTVDTEGGWTALNNIGAFALVDILNSWVDNYNRTADNAITAKWTTEHDHLYLDINGGTEDDISFDFGDNVTEDNNVTDDNSATEDDIEEILLSDDVTLRRIGNDYYLYNMGNLIQDTWINNSSGECMYYIDINGKFSCDTAAVMFPGGKLIYFVNGSLANNNIVLGNYTYVFNNGEFVSKTQNEEEVANDAANEDYESASESSEEE